LCQMYSGAERLTHDAIKQAIQNQGDWTKHLERHRLLPDYQLIGFSDFRGARLRNVPYLLGTNAADRVVR